MIDNLPAKALTLWRMGHDTLKIARLLSHGFGGRSAVWRGGEWVLIEAVTEAEVYNSLHRIREENRRLVA